MNFTKKELPKSMMEITVVIIASDMDGYFDKAAVKLSENMKIKGFRPGKVPIDTVEQAVGSQELFNEAARIAVKQTFSKIISENNIEAIGSPDIQIIKIARHNDFEYKAKVAVLPKVELPDYKNFPKQVKREKVDVSDKELKDAMDYLKKSRAKFITVNREAAKGDRVDVDFSANDLDGNKIENSEGKDRSLVIGDNLFIKEFEDNLIGMNAGEEKEFQVTFPDDYYDKGLNGKKVVFKVKVNIVQQVDLPELNDDFAKGLGDFSDIRKLEENIRDGLMKEKELKEDNRWQNEVLRKIAEKSKMEIPDILIDSEMKRFIDSLKNNIEQTGLKFNDYLNHLKKTVEDLEKENRGEVENNVKIGLILKAIADKEKIEISNEEVEEKINREILKHYKTIDEARKNIDMSRMKDYYYGIIRNGKVVQLLKNLCLEH